jgi:hypothetical protein
MLNSYDDDSESERDNTIFFNEHPAQGLIESMEGQTENHKDALKKQLNEEGGKLNKTTTFQSIQHSGFKKHI